jgi:hypothetical protein
MGSGTVIYVPSFIKIGSSVQRLTGGKAIHTHTHKHIHGQQRDIISLLDVFKIRNVGFNFGQSQ